MNFTDFIQTQEAQELLQGLLQEFGYTEADGDPLIFAFTKVGQNFADYKNIVLSIKKREELVSQKNDIQAQIDEIDNGEFNQD